MEKSHNVLEIPLLILKMLGLYSTRETKRILAFTIFYTFLLAFVIIMAAFAQYKSTGGSIFEFLGNAEGINGYFQILVKICLTTYQQRKLFKILSDTKRFWKSGVSSHEVKIKLDNLAANIVRLQKFYLYSGTIVAFLLNITAVVEKRMPVGYWNVHGYDFLFKITFLGQFLTVPLATSLAAGFDCLFLALSAEVTIQFRILCYCLQDLNIDVINSESTEKEYYNKIKLYVKHHIFLLRFAESLQDYFSGAMLIEYLTISPLICAGMYITFESTNFERTLQHVTITLTLLIQLSVYCFTAHIVSSEALAVSEAIYFSEWYTKHFSDLSTPIMLIIQRSQRGIVFTAGGLIEINLRTLITVLRVSYSACTAMRALKSKH